MEIQKNSRAVLKSVAPNYVYKLANYFKHNPFPAQGKLKIEAPILLPILIYILLFYRSFIKYVLNDYFN